MAIIGEVNEIPWKFVIQWKIKDFFSLSSKENEFYSSPSFSFANTSWCLMIYPNGLAEAPLSNGQVEESIGYIGVYLHKSSSGPPIHVNYLLGLKTVDQKIDPKYHRTHDFKIIEGFGCHKVISRADILGRESELMPSGVLTVICKMKYPESTTTANINIASGSSILPLKNKILEDLKQMFLKQEHCDVVIRVKGQEFPAHRNILSARSAVFASTFRNDMKEKESGIVDIEDCDPFSFSSFLSFLYCEDESSLSQENVFSLFTAADKYDVPDLREKCVSFMKKNLTVDRFCETITLALQHSETELIDLATDFFVKNAEKILETVKWQTFAAENPTQSNELFLKFVKSVKHLISSIFVFGQE